MAADKRSNAAVRALSDLIGTLFGTSFILAHAVLAGVFLYIHKLQSVHLTPQAPVVYAANANESSRLREATKKVAGEGIPDTDRNSLGWWIKLEDSDDKSCPNLEFPTPLMPIGTPKSNLNSQCYIPSKRRIFRAYRLASLHEMDVSDLIDGAISTEYDALSLLEQTLHDKLNAGVPARDIRRMEIFASDTSTVGFLNSLVGIPWRFFGSFIFAKFDSPPKRSVHAYFGKTHSGSSSKDIISLNDQDTSLSFQSDQCPRTLNAMLEYDPVLLHILSDSPLYRIDIDKKRAHPLSYFNIDPTYLAVLLADDLAEGVPWETETCIRYYLNAIRSYHRPQSLSDEELTRALDTFSDIEYDEKSDVAKLPPSPFLRSVISLCTGESPSSFPVRWFERFEWTEAFALLGIRRPLLSSGVHVEPLDRIYDRWRRWGDVFSPCYYQATLVLVTTSTVYWYLVPLTMWLITSFCSSAPIILAHVPRLLLYLCLVIWRYYGLYKGLQRFERYKFGAASFDASDHLIMYQMQLIILTLEIIAAARAAFVLRSPLKGHSKPSTFSRIIAWIFDMTIERISAAQASLNLIHRPLRQEADPLALMEPGKRIEALQIILETFQFAWIPMAILGCRYGHSRDLWWNGSSMWTWMLGLFGGWFFLYIAGFYSMAVSYCLRTGLFSLLRDLIDLDEAVDLTSSNLISPFSRLHDSKGMSSEGESTSPQLQDALLDSPLPTSALSSLMGVIMVGALCIMITLYASFYTALFFHTRRESLSGLLFGFVGLTLPTIVLLETVLTPQSIGLVERSSKM